MSKLFISIIIPCFNEEEVIRDTHQRIKGVLLSNKYSNHEIIYVNDGSRDSTMVKLNEIAKKDSKVRVISFSRNFGHQSAVTAGINHCHGDIAIIIDADLQDPPEIFPEMIRKYTQEKCNVVYGVRKQRDGESFFKIITAKLFYRIMNYFSEVHIPLDTGDFRLIDRKVINEYNSLKEKSKYVRGLISWIGFKQEPIYYNRDARFAGETKYPLKKMIKFATIGIMYFTSKPLKLALFLGAFSIGIDLFLVVYVILSKFISSISTVPGWTSTLLIVLFLGGVQLVTIGIIGEYIGTIFNEIKNRPEYIVSETVNLKRL